MKKVLDQELVKTIAQGRSPVRGEGRFKRYSDSYRKQIKNEAAFFKKGGKTIGVTTENLKGRDARLRKNWIKNFNGDRIPEGKKVSPVNLKLSGKLHASYFSAIKRFIVTIGFDNVLADIHNRLGAGKSRVVRRMLPGKGEKFNANITRRLKDAIRRKFPKSFNRG